ncbi:Putative uncharacterized protein [Moritella viscosa]|uniref:Uncharacterized protein n=1 Tax=Moritella viscosa TaxID=80854 RepID=A0A1L0APF3_9GAMM|nr:Putative uncharacterized protein [Moritella viscosa]
MCNEGLILPHLKLNRLKCLIYQWLSKYNTCSLIYLDTALSNSLM